LRKILLIAVVVPLLFAAGWYYFQESALPNYGPLYREFAYITNGKSNTVTVIDLRSFRPYRTLQVGTDPTGLAANPKRNEIYVVNTDSSNISVIDAEQNKVVGTISSTWLPMGAKLMLQIPVQIACRFSISIAGL
jgi:YVTN family beta-propeller protein